MVVVVVETPFPRNWPENAGREHRGMERLVDLRGAVEGELGGSLEGSWWGLWLVL